MYVSQQFKRYTIYKALVLGCYLEALCESKSKYLAQLKPIQITSSRVFQTLWKDLLLKTINKSKTLTSEYVKVTIEEI